MARPGWTNSTYEAPNDVWPRIEMALVAIRGDDGPRVPRKMLIAAALLLAAEDPKLLQRLYDRAALLDGEG